MRLRLLSGHLHSRFDFVGDSVVVLAMAAGHIGNVSVWVGIGSSTNASPTRVTWIDAVRHWNCCCSLLVGHRIYVIFFSRS